MMSYDQWLEYILEIVRAIASREHQERVWLGPRPEINWVGDLYNELGEEFGVVQARDADDVPSLADRFEDLHRRISESIATLNSVENGTARTN